MNESQRQHPAPTSNGAGNVVQAAPVKSEHERSESTNHSNASPTASASDNSSRVQRRRNKPSLSCETCTVRS